MYLILSVWISSMAEFQCFWCERTYDVDISRKHQKKSKTASESKNPWRFRPMCYECKSSPEKVAEKQRTRKQDTVKADQQKSADAFARRVSAHQALVNECNKILGDGRQLFQFFLTVLNPILVAFYNTDTWEPYKHGAHTTEWIQMPDSLPNISRGILASSDPLFLDSRINIKRDLTLILQWKGVYVMIVDYQFRWTVAGIEYKFVFVKL